MTKAELEAQLKQVQRMYESSARENRELRDKVNMYERFFSLIERVSGIRRYDHYGS